MSKRSTFIAVALLAALPARSAETPRFFDPGARLAAATLTDLPTLRFVTTGDFAPFNSIGPTGNPVGYNVDLAREICRELGLLDRCVIRALPLPEAIDSVRTGQAEALIAGLSINPATRADFAFSLPYMPLPARFVVRAQNSSAPDDRWANRRVGVAAGLAHERMLRDYFPLARVVTFTREDWMLDGLADGSLDAAFGDGMRMSLWLGGNAGRTCCVFSGGPYLAPEYLGFGMAIAARRDASALVTAFDFALRELERKGVTGELYLRYFPIGFY